MLFLARRSLRAHPLRSLLTALAIALGVAMMLSASVIGQAASQSAERLSQANATDAVIQSGPAFNTLIFQALLVLVGVIILFTAGFVIANAFGMAVTARLKELGALRTLGMTRRQVLNLVLIEAGGVGLAGAIGGLLLGVALAGVALQLAGMGENLSVPVWALIASPLIGFTVTVGAALLPALQASRISPLQALKPESSVRAQPPRPFLPAAFIVLLLVGLGLYAFIGKPDVFTAIGVLLPAMVALLTLVAALMPALVGPVANLARPWLIRWVGNPAGRLAADNLQRHPTRAALTAGAMTAGLTMMIAISGLMTVFLKGGLLTFATIAREDRVVLFNLTDPATFRAENSLQMFIEAPPLPPELLARLQILAKAGQVELDRLDMVPIPAELSPTPSSPGVFMDPEVFVPRSFAFSEGNVEDALRYFARGPAVLLLPITAQRLNLQVGDTVSVQTLSGSVDFTVAGIGADVWVMTAFSFTDGQKYFGVTEPTFMGISVHEGQNQEVVLKKVDDLVADYGLVAFDMKTLLREFFRIGDQIIGLMNALLLLTVLVAALGVVNTMVINVTERQREIGMLRAIGATQKQVRQMVVAEGVTLGLFAVAAAVLVSFIIVLAYFLLVSPNGLQSLGFRLNWEIVRTGFLPALPVMAQATLTALIFAPLIAGLAAYYPAKQAAALDVIDATRSEQLTLQPPTTRREEGVDIEGRALPRSLPLFLAQRALSQNQTRTILSVLAVALGAAMTIAGDVIGGAIINALSQSEDVIAISGGVLGQIDPILKGIGLTISVVAGFLIFNTFLMSITQRRQQIGTLRSLGMTRAQVLRMVLVEALLVSGAGVALGILLGPLMGRSLIALLKASGSPVFTAFKERDVPLLVYALAIGFGMSMSLLAALVPAMHATRISPLVALRTESLPATTKNPKRSGYMGLGLLLLISLNGLFFPPAVWIQPPYDLLLTLALGLLWILGITLALPASIGWLAQALRHTLTPRSGVGILILDNLQRGRVRVLLTIASLAVGLTLMVGVAGFFPFYTTEIFGPTLRASRDMGGWTLLKIDPLAGPGSFTELDSIRLTDEQITAARALIGERGALQFSDFVIVPQLSYFYDTYFSFIIDPRFVRDSGTFYFQFSEGNWETALPILDNGCGLLLTPSVARKNNAHLYDTLTLPGKNGEVSCTIAGIGQTFIGASLIGSEARAQFIEGAPFGLLVSPQPNSDAEALESDLQHFAAQNDLHILSIRELISTIMQVLETVPFLFQGFLLLAIFAAALGMVNTTLLSVTERRQELGQLRAIGATRVQVQALVIGEAAFIGFIGGGVGLLAGVGLVALIALVYGGNAMGVGNYQPYAALLVAVRPALWVGGGGLLLAPLVSACAAYFPARQLLSGAAIDTLNPEQVRPLTRQRVAGIFSRGSIQTRFVLGTSLLLLVVLASLIQVVTTHARNYLAKQLRDSASAMVGWNATLIEGSLPADAQTLDLDQLAQAQGQSFDAEAMLRFRSLMDDLTEGGLEQFVIADHDNVVVVSFDQRDLGDTLDPLADPQRTTVREETPEGERVPRIVAQAPLHNTQGDFVGSLHMTLRLTEVQDFLDRVRNILWAVGAVIVLVGLVASYLLSQPLTRATRSLAVDASRITRGDYSPLLPHSRGASPPLLARFSIRTRLTLLMTLLVVALVGGVGLFVVPIEHDQLERTSQDGILTVVQWIGDFISTSIPPTADAFDLSQLLTLGPKLGVTGLQGLTQQPGSQSIVYLTITNQTGQVVLTDQPDLQDQPGAIATQSSVIEGEWRGEKIWVASTPLRQGQAGAQIGTLSVGFARSSVAVFLTEAQTLFWLTGLSAVLAGVLLAQALGGAVAAPVEQMVSDTRRVAQGDLKVKFGVGAGLGPAPTADELSQLAYAFNQMVAGLREREKLRDLFGRYVSREVSEAVLSGRVSLKGERKTITCLYVDMRGSTTFAEKYQPEEVMAALNEYFEVIILATEMHGGIVNRFVGDEAVCVFGAPTEYPDHADRALQAALAIRAGLAYLHQKRASLDLPNLQFGMGLNSGVVTAGATGSEERQEYTVIGDAMNVGARIQALTKTFPDHDILLSEFTRAALREAAVYDFLDLGEAELRGKSQPVRIYGLMVSPPRL